MPATRHYVYWRMLTPEHARVVSVWSALRARGPAL